MTLEQVGATTPITFNPTGPRPLVKRDVRWDERAQLHQQLGIDPPTATYILEALAADVAFARRAAQQPTVPGHAHFDRLPLDALPTGGQRRRHTTWRTFSAAVCVGNRPPPAPSGNTPRADESARSSAPAPADHSTTLGYAERVLGRVHGRHVWGRQVQRAMVANLVRPAPCTAQGGSSSPAFPIRGRTLSILPTSRWAPAPPRCGVTPSGAVFGG